MRHWVSRVGGAAIAMALAGASVPARAQSASDEAAAEELFSEGRKLMAAHQYAQACPKFVASLRLDRGVGTMLNLADCYEQNGQTASAWAEFREAISAARDAGSRQREQLARDRASKLEARLSRMTIQLAPGVPASGVTIKRDGEVVDRALVGTPIPVDPGSHVIAASAPGKRPWTSTVKVGTNGAKVTVTVPALENGPGAAVATTPGAAPASAPTGEAAPASGVGPASAIGPGDSAAAAGTGDSGGLARSGSGQRTAAFIAGGVGVAGLAVGSIFGWMATSNWHQADRDCPSHFGCSQAAVDEQQRASSQAAVATVGFIAGGVGLAASVVLFLTAPRTTASGAGASAAERHRGQDGHGDPRLVATHSGVRIDAIDIGPSGLRVRGSF